MPSGGKRAGAGRKKGTVKPATVDYHRRIPQEFVEPMDRLLNELKTIKNPSKTN